MSQAGTFDVCGADKGDRRCVGCIPCSGASGGSCPWCVELSRSAAAALFSHLGDALAEARLLPLAHRAWTVGVTLRIAGGGAVPVLGCVELLEAIGLTPERSLDLLRAPGPRRPLNAAALWAPLTARLRAVEHHPSPRKAHA